MKKSASTSLAVCMLALTACGKGRAPQSSDGITVVSAPARAPAIVKHIEPAAIPTVPQQAEQPPERSALLTIEESDRIRTPEMWSEPL